MSVVASSQKWVFRKIVGVDLIFNFAISPQQVQ